MKSEERFEQKEKETYTQETNGKTMNVVIDKVMKRQRESDDKYVKLEFKHMKMEEQLMEMANE